MKFKIAVCVYGQPRTWKYCAPWILASLSSRDNMRGEFKKITEMRSLDHRFLPSALADVEVDYFLNIKNYNTFANFAEGIPEQDLPQSEIDEIIATYKPKKFSVTSKEDDAKYYGREGDWHYAKMASSMCASNDLKKQYEMETGELYDLVIFHRFDTLTGPTTGSLLDKILSMGIEPMTLFTATKADFRMYRELWKHGFDDMMFAGDTLTADLLMGWLYRQFESIVFENDVDFRFGPNVVLTRGAQQCSLNRRHADVQLAIVRDNADLSKPVLTSFQYHKDFWKSTHIAMS